MSTPDTPLCSKLPALAAVLTFLAPATARSGDWGENWGQFLWGPQALSVPSLPGVLGVALACALLAMLWILSRRTRARVLLPTLLVCIPLVAVATQIDLPYVFENGTTADAFEVNDNFTVLETESNDQDTRLGVLEANGIVAGQYTSVVCNDFNATGEASCEAVCPVGQVVLRCSHEAGDIAMNDTCPYVKRVRAWSTNALANPTLYPQDRCVVIATCGTASLVSARVFATCYTPSASPL